MGIGSGIYMYDVVVKRSRSLSHLLMSSCKNAGARSWRQTPCGVSVSDTQNLPSPN